MRIFILSILFMISLNASKYDTFLLRTQASIFPKIILLDKAIAGKTQNNEITLAIHYDTADLEDAQNLQKLIQTNYYGELGSYRFTTQLHPYGSKIPSSVTAHILLKGSAAQQQHITAMARQSRQITFAYDYKDFSNQILISLLVKEKTYIYLNKEALSHYGLKFIPVFYKIVKVY